MILNWAFDSKLKFMSKILDFQELRKNLTNFLRFYFKSLFLT